MMTFKTFGLLAAFVALIALAAGAFTTHHTIPATLSLLLFGTAVVNYMFPISKTGQTTAPSQTQARKYNYVTGTVVFGDTDTTATFTHNLSSSTTSNSQGFPQILCYPISLTSATETAPPLLTYAMSVNSVTITKVSATGSGGLFQVIVSRGPLV